ncbi:MAG: efflux RND transporter periplasmic adaptor subunit [Sandaracinaceae bacterium]|nr:efflux RND transporter periplasmic adaptor subunit [Sandaracinaceae bacterium]
MDVDEPELRPAPIGVRVVPLACRRTGAPLAIEGRVAASRAVVIKAPSSGVLAGLDVQLGASVREGELLATLGADAHDQRVLAAEAQVCLLEAQLEERRDALLGASSRGEAPDRIASFESKVRVAEHRLAHERLQAERHARARALVEVHAPFDARVAAVNAAAGATVPAGHTLIELVAIDPAVVVVDVPTWVAAHAVIGAAVEVRADCDRAPRAGRVSHWAPTANDGVRRVLVEVDNADGRLAAGEGALALFDVGERDAFFAPRAALVTADRATCLQLVEHSVARIERVRVVGGDADEVEVAGRLHPSQLVVLHAERPLRAEAEVIIRGDH